MTPGVGPDVSSPVPRSADVARLAGVSRKTVSRVLNDEPYVSDEARRRVLAAAEELGYRLNHAARALASGRTRSSASSPWAPPDTEPLPCWCTSNRPSGTPVTRSA